MGGFVRVAMGAAQLPVAFEEAFLSARASQRSALCQPAVKIVLLERLPVVPPIVLTTHHENFD